MTLRDRFTAIKESLQDKIPEELQQLFEPLPEQGYEEEYQQEPVDFPHRTMVPLNLGVCSDGLPVRIDLNDPELDPMLAISNEVKDIQQWVEHILHGLTEQRNEGEIEIALLKRRSTNLSVVCKAAEEKGILINLHEMSPRNPWEYLYEVAQRAEQRFEHREQEAPPLVLLIEDLTFLKFAPPDLQLTFEWLLQFGHEVGIQTIAAITCEDGYSASRWLRYFPTRIFGSVNLEDDQHFNYYDTIPPVPQKIRYTGTTFAVWNNTHWLFFALKNPQETRTNQQENAIL